MRILIDAFIFLMGDVHCWPPWGWWELGVVGPRGGTGLRQDPKHSSKISIPPHCGKNAEDGTKSTMGKIQT